MTTRASMKKLYELIQKNFLSLRPTNLLKKERISKQSPLITISRETGSGGRPIAVMVAKKLGYPWKVFHKEIVDELSKMTHLEKNLIRDVDENTIPLAEEVISDFFGKRYLNLNSYHKSLVKVLSAVGQQGFAIIVGRGAHYLFPHALKVRVICEMHQRVTWVMEYEHVPEKEAKRRIEASDRRRIEFEESVFRHDPRKAHHYDLVIRTGPDLSIEDATDIIVRAAKRRFQL